MVMLPVMGIHSNRDFSRRTLAGLWENMVAANDEFVQDLMDRGRLLIDMEAEAMGITLPCLRPGMPAGIRDSIKTHYLLIYWKNNGQPYKYTTP